jgi:hypothetical protein
MPTAIHTSIGYQLMPVTQQHRPFFPTYHRNQRKPVFLELTHCDRRLYKLTSEKPEIFDETSLFCLVKQFGRILVGQVVMQEVVGSNGNDDGYGKVV